MEETIKECVEATELHIKTLYELSRKLPVVGSQSFIRSDILEVIQGLEITLDKLERL